MRAAYKRETIVTPRRGSRIRVAYSRGLLLQSSTKGPSAGASAAPGDVAWLTPGNITADDGNTAAVGLTAGQDSELLKASQFDWSAIPSNANILGVIVGIEALRNSVDLESLTLQIMNAGSLVGSNRASEWDIPMLAGSPMDYIGEQESFALWGAAVEGMSVSDWQNANSGVALAVTDTGAGAVLAVADYLTMQLFYEHGY